MPKDLVLAAANHTMAEWDKRTRELKKKEMQRKQQARDRGEEVSSDDDDGDDDDSEVAADVDWGILEDEDTLTSAHPSMQGPFLFHMEGSESVRSVEAGESAALHGVSAEDRWMGESGSAAADPEVMVERGGPGAAPHEMMEGRGSGAAPHEVREMSPPASEQGAGSKRSHPDESGQGSGDLSPKRFHRPRASA